MRINRTLDFRDEKAARRRLLNSNLMIVCPAPQRCQCACVIAMTMHRPRDQTHQRGTGRMG